ncbi:MAG: hypothetical protein JST67_00535 [Bacteroidetes bacterium]|nr:hypothetical protein [Bacteroidota bacterium]
MKLHIRLFVCCLGVFLTASSCTKAGKGGNATVVCSVWNTDNNSAPVNGVTVYVSYGQSTPPSANTSGYDDHQVATATSNTVAFSGLQKGTYYFMAVGTQTVTSTQGTATVQVSGGAPYSLMHGSGINNATIGVTY